MQPVCRMHILGCINSNLVAFISSWLNGTYEGGGGGEGEQRKRERERENAGGCRKDRDRERIQFHGRLCSQSAGLLPVRVSVLRRWRDYLARIPCPCGRTRVRAHAYAVRIRHVGTRTCYMIQSISEWHCAKCTLSNEPCDNEIEVQWGNFPDCCPRERGQIAKGWEIPPSREWSNRIIRVKGKRWEIFHYVAETSPKRLGSLRGAV